MEVGTFKDFKEGCRDGVPICLGYFAVSFAFGIGAAGIGMTVFQAALTSLLNVTSAGQFSALDVIKRNGSLIELAMLQLIINLRYMLMSASLSQKLDPKTSTLNRLLISYGVTDEIFGVSVLKKGKLYPMFSYGIIITSVFGWVTGTAFGAFAGQILPQILVSCLGLAIYGMFIAIIVPDTKRSNAVLGVVVGSMILSSLFTYAPYLKMLDSGYRIILITVVVAAIAAVVAPRKEKDNE